MGQIIDLTVFRESRQLVRLDMFPSQEVSLKPAERRRRLQCLSHNKNLLFPKIELSEWSYVIGLRPLTKRCECGEPALCDVPFATPCGQAAGLMAVPCDCGSEKLSAIHVEFPPDVKRRYMFIFSKEKRGASRSHG